MALSTHSQHKGQLSGFCEKSNQSSSQGGPIRVSSQFNGQNISHVRYLCTTCQCCLSSAYAIFSPFWFQEFRSVNAFLKLTQKSASCADDQESWRILSIS